MVDGIILMDDLWLLFFSFPFAHVDRGGSGGLSLDILVLPVLSFLPISFFPRCIYLRHCWLIGIEEDHVTNLLVAPGDMSIS